MYSFATVLDPHYKIAFFSGNAVKKEAISKLKSVVTALKQVSAYQRKLNSHTTGAKMLKTPSVSTLLLKTHYVVTLTNVNFFVILITDASPNC
jgi:hypothetical protein